MKLSVLKINSQVLTVACGELELRKLQQENIGQLGRKQTASYIVVAVDDGKPHTTIGKLGFWKSFKHKYLLAGIELNLFDTRATFEKMLAKQWEKEIVAFATATVNAKYSKIVVNYGIVGDGKNVSHSEITLMLKRGVNRMY